MNKQRITRINEEILRETAILIRSKLRDPKISAMTSVTKVETTADLKYCKIYVSVLGNEEDKANVMEGLKHATGFIRRELAASINLRVTPELKFNLDESLEYGMRISRLIDEVNKPRESENDE